MTEDIFDKIETNIMKVLTRTPDKSINQFELYSKVLDEFDIKDPIEKENLKIRFLIVLRKLSSIFDNVEVFSKNGVLSAIFKNVDDLTDDLPYDLSDDISDKSSAKSYKINSNDKDYLDEEFKENDGDMPSEISVIRFIIDENIEKYYSKKDFDGNTILHKLVSYNDFERFKKIFLRDDVSLYDLNNKDKTPIDLITDIRFSNLLISQLIEDSKKLEYEMMEMKNKIYSLDKEYCILYLQTKYLYQMLIFYICCSVIKFLFF